MNEQLYLYSLTRHYFFSVLSNLFCFAIQGPRGLLGPRGSPGPAGQRVCTFPTPLNTNTLHSPTCVCSTYCQIHIPTGSSWTWWPGWSQRKHGESYLIECFYILSLCFKHLSREIWKMCCQNRDSFSLAFLKTTQAISASFDLRSVTFDLCVTWQQWRS